MSLQMTNIWQCYKQLETQLCSGQCQESFLTDKYYKVLLAMLTKGETELPSGKGLSLLLGMKHLQCLNDQPASSWPAMQAWSGWSKFQVCCLVKDLGNLRCGDRMVAAAVLTAVGVQSGLSKTDLLGQVNMDNSYPDILHGEIL